MNKRCFPQKKRKFCVTHRGEIDLSKGISLGGVKGHKIHHRLFDIRGGKEEEEEEHKSVKVESDRHISESPIYFVGFFSKIKGEKRALT